MTAIALQYDEAAHLAGYTARLVAWDERAAVRVQVRGRVIGVYGAPPLDCLTLLVLPLAEPAGEGTDGLDTVVSAGRLRDIIGDVTSAWGPGARVLPLPDPIGPRAELAVLPPREGWLPGEQGLAGDVAPLVAGAAAQARAALEAAPGASEAERQSIVDDVWAQPGWGALPLPALHAARGLGFLSHDGMKVASATAPGWKRFTAPGGQVFVRTTGLPALSLAVLR